MTEMIGGWPALTADPKTSIHAAVLRAERLEAEVARLQSERDAATAQSTITEDRIIAWSDEWSQIAGRDSGASTWAGHMARRIGQCSGAEVTAAKADDEERAKRAVEVWYSHSPNDPEWANPVHRMSAAIRAADTRAELGDS